jgi:enoyl-CoA hydratase/carnithine racemase
LSTIELDVESRDGGLVARLAVNRPGKLNSLDGATVQALADAARRLAGEPELRAVVLTGAGPKAFIGGADIAAMAGFDRAAAVAFITGLHEAIAALRAIPVPVIARVNGWCLGAGLEVAIACDLRVASALARFGMPEVKVGIPSVIEAALLPRLVGYGRAAELVLLGETIDAAQAERSGLVEKVVAADQLDVAVEAWLSSILAAGPRAMRLQKSLLRAWEDAPLDAAVQAGIAAFGTAYETDEPQRMMRAFAARRR